MMIGSRLRSLRIAKDFSQFDIEKGTNLARSYISRVENDHTSPSIGTLEKWARALGIPLYAIFYDGDSPSPRALLPKAMQPGESRKETRFLRQFCIALARIEERDRQLLLKTAARMASRKRRSPKQAGPAKVSEEKPV